MKRTPLILWLPMPALALCKSLNAVWAALRRAIRPLTAVTMTALSTATAFGGTTWDGGGADDNWGTADNWNPDGAPPVGSTVDLTFDGVTRLTPFNNYTAFDDFHSLFFAAGAGSFTVSGNSVDLFGKIENYSTNTQTVALSDIAINAGQPGTGEFNPVNGDLVINSANVFTNGNNVRVFGVNNKTVTFGAGTVISQTGGVTVEQASNVVLLGANTYTGATTVNAGSLTVGNGGTNGSIAAASAVSIAGGAQMTWNNANTTSNVILANNISGAGTLTLQGQNAVSALQTSVYDLSGNNAGFTGTLNINRSILWNTTAQSEIGSAAINIQDRGTMTFNGGSFNNSITVQNGAGWHHNAGGDVVLGAIRLEGTNTLTGNITLNNTTGVTLGDNTGANSTIGGYSSGNHALNGVISGAGELSMSRYTSWNGGTTQAVNITLGGSSSNTYTGKTVVDGQGAVASLILAKTGGAVAIPANTTVQMGSGTGGQFNLRMGGSNQFGSGVVMNFVNASGQWGRFDLLDTNQTVAGLNAGTLSAQGGAVIQNGGLNINTTTGTAVLTLDGSGTYLYNGYMRNVDTGGSGKLALVKNGTGTQTLAGNQITLNGGVTVNSGTLKMADTTGFTSPTTVNSGGTLTSNRNALGGGARATILGNAVTLNGGTLNIDNAGSGLAGGWTTFNAANGLTGSGTINVNSGVFSRDNTVANAINTSATVNVAAGAFFGAGRGGNSTIGALNGAGVVSTLWSGTNAGSITVGNGDGSGTFTGTLSGNGTSATDLTQNGGVLSVIKTGAGTQTFSGTASNYTGSTTVNGGTLILDGTNAINTGAWTIGAGANLTVNTTNAAVDNWVAAGALTGTGTLTKTGSGWFQFRATAPANFAGSIVINGGRFGNGFNTTVWTNSTADVFVASGAELDLRTDDMRVDELTGSGTVVNTYALGETNNTLTVGSNDGSSQFDGVIRGIGGVGANNTSIDVGRNSLAKIGTGTFTLTGASVYGGTTTVNDGTLRIAGGDDRLPVGTTLTVNGGATSGGTFDLNARSQAVAGLSGGSGAVPGIVTNSGTGTGTINVTGTSTFAGNIQDGGAGSFTALTKSGTGTLSLTGTNTQSGQTLITGGALRQGSAGALSPNSNINMNGGIVELGVSDYTASPGTGNGQVQFTGSGGFGAFGGDRIVNIGGAVATLTWGSGGFVPSGSSFILSGPNSDSTTRFLNPVNLNGGSERITSLGGTAAIDAEIAGDISNGSLTLAPGNTSFQITSQISAPLTIENGATATNNMQAILQRTGGNAAAGGLQIGVPTAAAGTYATVKLGADEQIADSAVVTYGAAQGKWSYLNLNGFNETIGGLSNLSGADGGVVQLVEADASPATNSTLTLNVTSGTQSYYGHIRDRGAGFSNHPTAGKLNFIKTGAGTQELATWNSQSWSGTTDVQQGALKLILNNGVNLPGAVSVSSGATLELAPAGTNNYNISGAVSGAGDVIKSGTGTATFLNSAVSLTGNITVNEGRLRNDGNGANWSASTANLTVASAGTFDLRADSVNVNSFNGSGTVTNSFGTGIGATDTLTTGVLGGGGHFSGSITDGGTGTGENRGGLSYAKTGAGTQILSGTNTYSGSTTVSGGTLQIGNGGTTGTLGAGPVVNDSALVFDRSNDSLAPAAISGTGTLTKNGTGVLTLAAANTYAGATTVNAGTLRLGAAQTAPAGSLVWLDAADGATINTGGGGAVTSWTNKGSLGAAADAIATAGQEPTFVGSEPAMNAQPVIHFDAATGGIAPFDRLVSPANFTTGDVSIVYAGRLSGGSNQRLLAGANNNWLLGTWNGNSESAFFNNGFLNNAVTPDTTMRVYSGSISATGAAEFFVNGIARGTGTGAQGPNGLSLGGGFSGNPVTEYSSGDIGELLVFSGVLSAEDRRAVEAYLNRKWAGTGTANVLPATTAVSLTAAGATLDVNGVTQTVGSITGVTGSAITLGGGALTSGADNTDAIFAGDITGTGSLTKTGTGKWTLSGTNNIGGVVTSAGGTLSITGTTTALSFDVASGGTLGGTGTIATSGGALTMNAGSTLSPGSSPGVLVVSLSGGTMDISGAVIGSSTGALVFELGNPGTDGVLLTNSFLEIGSGLLEWGDFNFSTAAGFGPGTYTLFDGDSAVSGTLSSNLTGTLGGYFSQLTLANGSQDIVLLVVPEPGTALLTAAAPLLLLRRRRPARKA